MAAALMVAVGAGLGTTTVPELLELLEELLLELLELLELVLDVLLELEELELLLDVLELLLDVLELDVLELLGLWFPLSDEPPELQPTIVAVINKATAIFLNVWLADLFNEI